MKNKHRYAIFCVICSIYLKYVYCHDENRTSDISSSMEMNIGRKVFSPRMDFDQWKPLGRGDPLKNDPTYDYVPPVLDRVQYWVDPALRKPDPSTQDQKKTEILMLGVLSKKPASKGPVADRRDSFDNYLKYTDNYKHNSHRRVSKPTLSYLPESVFSQISKYIRNDIFKGSEQKVPYTVLVPPPMKRPSHLQSHMSQQLPSVAISNSFSTGSSPSPSSVSIQPSNLVYQSSSLSDGLSLNIETTDKPYFSTKNPFSRVKQDFRNNVVFNKHLQPPESFIQIEFSPYNNYSNNHLVGDASHQHSNFVSPPSNIEVKYQGIVDNSDQIKNTFVNIPKPEVQTSISSPGDSIFMNHMNNPNMGVYSHLRHPIQEPSTNTKEPINYLPETSSTPEETVGTYETMTEKVIKLMETMQPPPVTETPVYKQVTNPILDILIKESEKHKVAMIKQAQFVSQTPTVVVSSTFATTNPKSTIVEEDKIETSTVAEPTTVLPAIKPTLIEQTTQKYYKPIESKKNSLYFVIQGHSKVKTYGPSKQLHGISVQETNEIFEDTDNKFNVKHLHSLKKEHSKEENSRLGRSGDLQTLKHVVQTGLGAVDLYDSPLEYKENDGHKKHAHLGYGYQVGPDVSTETYHKGVVMEGRKLNV